MHRVILALMIAIAGCAKAPTTEGYRDPARQIYSSAVFDPAGLTEEWRQVADFAVQPGCAAGGVSFVPEGGTVRIAGQLCVAGKAVVLNGAMVPAGPGRFAVAGLDDPLWVLWADADLRTLVLGTPSGRFGMILNRGKDMTDDRLVAAREVLAWNGYDLDQLRLTR